MHQHYALGSSKVLKSLNYQTKKATPHFIAYEQPTIITLF